MKEILVILTFITFSILSFGQTDNQDCTGALGDVKWSVLKPDKFKEFNGDCWIPMEGQNVAASKLGAMGYSNVPDGRNMFLRAIDLRKTNRDDTGRPFGTIAGDVQMDTMRTHLHKYEDIYYLSSGSSSFFVGNGNAKQKILPNKEVFLKKFRSTGFPFFNTVFLTSKDNKFSVYLERETSMNQGLETRPKNVSFYLYVKIN